MEKAESRLQRYCLDLVLKKGHCTPGMLDLVLGGDLQNQCTATGYTMRELDAPLAWGPRTAHAAPWPRQWGWRPALQRAAGSGWLPWPAAISARRSGSSAPLLPTGASAPPLPSGPPRPRLLPGGTGGNGPFVRAVTFGRVRDYEICDINNMGAAMVLAAAETILRYCEDTGNTPARFDAVYTGDLGIVGTRLLKELLEKEDVDLEKPPGLWMILTDDVQHQDVQAGGSGAGCSAGVLCASALPALQKGEMKTGAVSCPLGR